MIVEERLELLVLARLAFAREDAEVASALRRFAPSSLSEGAWKEAVAAARGRLGASTDHAAQLAERLGAAPPKTWAALVDRVLPALAIGVAPGDGKTLARLKDRDTWTAAIGARLLGLWTTGAPPSLSAVCDAYVWRQLGLGGRPKRCPAEIRALFFQRELATDAAPPDRLLRLYVARELRAPRPDARQLRDAVVRAWLEGRDLGGAPRAEGPGFADAVRTATRTLERGVFGDRKVFIAAAFEAVCAEPSFAGLSLDTFKQRLLEAHRAGELVLARADLVAAMDPALVAASEVMADGASFHFVVREAAS